MKYYMVKFYDREMTVRYRFARWESESAMLNDLMKRGFKVIEYQEAEKKKG